MSSGKKIRVAKREPLPKVDHLESDDFAARVQTGALRLTSIGSENAYAVDAVGAEFYAKDVASAALLDARALVDRFTVEASLRNPVTLSGFDRDNLADCVRTGAKAEAIGAARRMHRGGYWVEIFDSVTRELLAGPFDPDRPAPAYVL